MGSTPNYPLLRADMIATLAEVNEIIAQTKKSWRPVVGQTSIYGAVDKGGRPLLADLIVARTNLLVAIAALPEEET